MLAGSLVVVADVTAQIKSFVFARSQFHRMELPFRCIRRTDFGQVH